MANDAERDTLHISIAKSSQSSNNRVRTSRKLLPLMNLYEEIARSSTLGDGQVGSTTAGTFGINTGRVTRFQVAA